ncbi:Hsp70 family protein [Longispora sp. K20-0274]|uniref:Hsp70 family protein n=1 Tax=Longispora sp. K20-0274 TaxID=3088255 RepID=UPI003999D905
MSEFGLGVDYGTSHTVAVLRWPDGRCRPLHFGASELLPSAVYAAGDGTLVTGADALRAGRRDPAGLEPNPKRRIDDGEVLLGAAPVPVTGLVAATLRTVLAEAVRVAGAAPAEVTVTCPAGWAGPRRAVLSAALGEAGFAHVALVSEPVAAATYFVSRSGADIPVGRCAVVYDLGAGTFDASVVRRTDTGFEVLATGGLDVGGLDLDAVVVDLVGRSVAGSDPEPWRRLSSPDGPADLRARHALWTEARHAKEALSRQSTALVHVPLVDREVPVGREEFEAAVAGLLGRTALAMMRTVADAGIGWAEVAGVFLVGGASRVPLVATVVHRACGIAPTTLEQPELVVAEGSLLTPGAPVPAESADAPASSVVPAVPVPEGEPPSPGHTAERGIAEVEEAGGGVEPPTRVERAPGPGRALAWAVGRSPAGWRWQRPAVIAAVLALLLLLTPYLSGDGAGDRGTGAAGPGRTADPGGHVSPGVGLSPTPGATAKEEPVGNQPSAPASGAAQSGQGPRTAGPAQTQPAPEVPQAAQTTGATLSAPTTHFTGFCGPGLFVDVDYTVAIQTSPGSTDTHYVVDFGDGGSESGDARTNGSGSVSRSLRHGYDAQNLTRDTTFPMRVRTTTPSARTSNTVQIVIDCTNY